MTPRLIKAVLFDFDGTLTRPGSLDFPVIKAAIGCPADSPILEFIPSLESESERRKARSILDRFEMEAAQQSSPNPGAEPLVRFLRSNGLKLGIISRNSLAAIRCALENFRQVTASDFDVIISRDDSVAPKPSPEAVLAAAGRMHILPDQLLMVGDFVFDIEAGQKAGVHTVLLTNRLNTHNCNLQPDYTIDDLSELRSLIEMLIPLRAGKLPNHLLSRFLRELQIGGAPLLLSPAVGEDVAAVSLENEEVLVLKTDPITFATDAIGCYAVVVNINDIATCGAKPRWLLVTLLFPQGTTPLDIRGAMADVQDVAARNGLIVCGGHTEVTDAVSRPVIVAQVAGTVSRTGLIEKSGMRQGDRVLLTKAIAIEGTCIAAREFAAQLAELGMPTVEIEKCRNLLSYPGISIVTEAQAAAAAGDVTAMHDVTEGGLATAIEELSAAGGHRIRVYFERIPILPETREICRLLSLDPLGMIGSGSLLIVCGPDGAVRIREALRAAQIEATEIGEVLEEGMGIEAVDSRDGGTVKWPHFEVDEIARLWAHDVNPLSPPTH